MSATGGQAGADLTPRIERLLQKQDASARARDVRRVFGGNARKAWAFELEAQCGVTPCILLSQVAGRHVDSDASLEYRTLAALNGKGVKAPAVIALDMDGEITGAPAIVMQRIDGVATATALLNPEGDTDAVQITCDLAKSTADLHAVDWRAAGLEAPKGDAALIQIEEWERQYLKDRLAPNPPLTFLFNWLKQHVPPQTTLSLVHGDLRPGNFLFQGDRINALLDWEMAHIGDPLEDVAWIYRDLWSPQKFVSLDDFVALYEARIGHKLDPRRLTYYRIFSEVKFATISTSASASFFRAGSRNLRYLDRAAKIPACLAQCFDLIKSQDWSGFDATA